MRYVGNLARWILLFLVLTVVFFLLLKRAPGVESKLVRNPDIFHYTNPRTYQLGTVAGLDVIRVVPGKLWTVVTWKPAYAPMLYTESLLFCGAKSSEMFVNLTSEDEIVIVYSRAVEVARVDSPPPSILACHSLDYVIKVNP
jgi:hypothetical protein